MTPQVTEALEASIAKWEENLLAKHPLDVKVGWSDCALCHLFHWEATSQFVFEATCVSCPVFEKTGQTFCYGSPYKEVLSKRMEWSDAWHDDPTAEHESERKACMVAVQAEINFLKSLRV